jgi:crotonobetainyl-CoA:carnitine CoA-transferase CaiB-like acyl-CoA transferase
MRLKVLDLSRVLAGPYCSMILADLGANVIKVERPKVGDDTRGWGPPFDDTGQSAYFLSINRNKLSIAADLGDRDDRRFILELVAGADVVLDNFLEGTMSRLGLDPDQVLAENPSLIWCSISGFGERTDRPGYDFVVQAECGWMAVTGARNGEPMKVGVALADVLAGKDAAIAVLAARAEMAESALPKDRRRIRVSLLQSARGALVNVGQNVLVTGREAGRWGNAHPNLVPYQLFYAEDRPLVIAVGSDSQWKSCARALELGDLMDDVALATNAGRVEHRERVVTGIAQRVRGNPAHHWIERLQSLGVPCGLVKSVKEALEGTGASAITGIPPSVPGSVRFPPPRLDEHGDAIRRLGWGAFS